MALPARGYFGSGAVHRHGTRVRRYEGAWSGSLCASLSRGRLCARGACAARRRCRHRSGRVATAIQRFGRALNLNVHFHTLAPDGVFACSDAQPGRGGSELPGRGIARRVPLSHTEQASLNGQAIRGALREVNSLIHARRR